MPAEGTVRKLAAVDVVGIRLQPVKTRYAARLVMQWAGSRQSRHVGFGTAYHATLARDCQALRAAIDEADLMLPDGMPMVWTLRLKGFRSAERVYGPDLTLLLLRYAVARRVAVGFYGGDQETLLRLRKNLVEQFPGLQISYAYSPPFRALSSAEDEDIIGRINSSGTRILFVGLGTPKQDYWMAAHRGRIQAVMLGVGAAFDFIAGTKPQAPRWMMRAGLEWLFRLATEPRRLWKRYLKHNPRFVFLFALQLLGLREFPPSR